MATTFVEPNLPRMNTEAVGRQVAEVARALTGYLADKPGVVTAGLSPEAALKEAHGRIEEIYKIRRS